MGRVWLDRRAHRGPTLPTALERVSASRRIPRCGWNGKSTKTLETRTRPVAVISRSSVSAWPSNSESRAIGAGPGGAATPNRAGPHRRRAETARQLFIPRKAVLSGARPQHALAAPWNRAYAFVDEFLHALAFVRLGRVEVALRIGGDAVHAVELAGLAPAVAEVGNFLQRFAHDDAHLLVLAIGEEHEPLLAILRERDIPGRARSERLLGIEPFLHELAVRLEYLHAVALAVAHVDQAVVRALDAMHRVAELLGGRRFRVVVPHGSVVRLVAVRTPVALHLSGIGVDHGDAFVEITVGDVGFVGLGIDPDLGHPPEVHEVVAAAVLSIVAELHQEFSVLGELQDLGVFRAVAAEPHVALVVDVDAVRPFRPLVARSRAAPGPDQVACLIEHEDRRGRAAALGDGRILFEPLLVDMQPPRAAMNDPDVILLVDPRSYGPAEQPMIRQGLRPQRVHFEHRRLDGGPRCARHFFEQSLTGSERNKRRYECRPEV